MADDVRHSALGRVRGDPDIASARSRIKGQRDPGPRSMIMIKYNRSRTKGQSQGLRSRFKGQGPRPGIEGIMGQDQGSRIKTIKDLPWLGRRKREPPNQC